MTLVPSAGRRLGRLGMSPGPGSRVSPFRPGHTANHGNAWDLAHSRRAAQPVANLAGLVCRPGLVQGFPRFGRVTPRTMATPGIWLNCLARPATGSNRPPRGHKADPARVGRDRTPATSGHDQAPPNRRIVWLGRRRVRIDRHGAIRPTQPGSAATEPRRPAAQPLAACPPDKSAAGFSTSRSLDLVPPGLSCRGSEDSGRMLSGTTACCLPPRQVRRRV